MLRITAEQVVFNTPQFSRRTKTLTCHARNVILKNELVIVSKVDTLHQIHIKSSTSVTNSLPSTTFFLFYSGRLRTGGNCNSKEEVEIDVDTWDIEFASKTYCNIFSSGLPNVAGSLSIVGFKKDSVIALDASGSNDIPFLKRFSRKV
ncbi:hypothetical protein KEM48_004582 [Puccinia striiformis f. sp. tritici PST-130]|nr:hypothetical protein KEM48_004582 [Puccinia striiformis f. sp. tritici PST-130]